MTNNQAINIAIHELQKAQRTQKGLAMYYRDVGVESYKADYEQWRKLNEAIEALQAMKEIA